MLKDYLPILLQAIVAIGFTASALILSVVIGRAGRNNPTKDTAYECGMPVEPGPLPRFGVKFYLMAMLFILFDIEIVFMYPWAVVYREFVATKGPSIFGSMLSFVGILTAGYFYAIKKGALDWKK
jgi:NADH-quinone oxidoreductase subunit A